MRLYQHKLWLPCLILFLALLWLCATPRMADAAPADASLAATISEADVIYPVVTAPGARLPISWVISGGTTISDTCVLWDVTGHEHRNDYAFRTAYRSGGRGPYTDHIQVPDDASAIFFRPIATVDGVEIVADREYSVPAAMAMNVGGAQYGLDASGQYWMPDRTSDASPQRYRFTGGTTRSVTQTVAGTDLPWLGQAQRVDLTGLDIWLTPDNYQVDLVVSLLLAELDATGPSQRLFSVTFERGTLNEVTLRDIDIWSRAGGANALITITQQVRCTIIPGVDEYLDVAFEPSVGSGAILNGLRVAGVAAVPQYELTRAIAGGTDDTYTDHVGPHNGDDWVLLGGDQRYHGGLRFQAMHIPQGAVIRYARLDVVAGAYSGAPSILNIHAHAADSSPSFATQAVVTNRPRTETAVAWNLSSGAWMPAQHYQSPDLSPVVQEVVDRDGWREGNALSLLLIAGDGQPWTPRRIYAFERLYENRARLQVYYSRAEDIPEPRPTPVGQLFLPMLLQQ